MLNLSKRLFLTCLFTDDVLQSVDHSQGKDSGNSLRQHAFEAIEEAPEEDDGSHMIEDDNEGDDPCVDEEGNFLANEDVASDVDDDLAIDDEDYHEALLVYARCTRSHERGSCCSWVQSPCCPLSVRQAHGQRKKVNLQAARLDVALVEEARKVLDDLPTLVAATERENEEDVQDQFVMVH